MRSLTKFKQLEVLCLRFCSLVNQVVAGVRISTDTEPAGRPRVLLADHPSPLEPF